MKMLVLALLGLSLVGCSGGFIDTTIPGPTGSVGAPGSTGATGPQGTPGLSAPTLAPTPTVPQTPGLLCNLYDLSTIQPTSLPSFAPTGASQTIVSGGPVSAGAPVATFVITG